VSDEGGASTLMGALGRVEPGGALRGWRGADHSLGVGQAGPPKRWVWWR
jgi:hypothetical protein